MLISHRGSTPVVDPSAFVAPTATLVGDVRVGPRARVMYGAVLDAEGASVTVGEACVIAENAVLRAVTDPAWPVELGDHVFVGPHATVLGAVVERCAYLATGAVVVQGARVARGACVAVHGFVHARTSIAAEAFVGPNCVAVGDTIFRPDQVDEIAQAIRAIDFAGAAFGTGSTWAAEPGHRTRRYEEMVEVRVTEFGAHATDGPPVG